MMMNIRRYSYSIPLRYRIFNKSAHSSADGSMAAALALD